MQEFTRTKDGFNYVYEKAIGSGETVIIKMPSVSPNKLSVSEIGWQSDGDVTLYGTLSGEPESANAIWQEINENEDINRAVYALKAVGGSSSCRLIIRAILA